MKIKDFEVLKDFIESVSSGKLDEQNFFNKSSPWYSLFESEVYPVIRSMCRSFPESDSVGLFISLILLRAAFRNEICIDLNSKSILEVLLPQITEDTLDEDNDDMARRDELKDSLLQAIDVLVQSVKNKLSTHPWFLGSEKYTRTDESQSPGTEENVPAPFVYFTDKDGTTLYLRSFFQYEQKVAEYVKEHICGYQKFLELIKSNPNIATLCSDTIREVYPDTDEKEHISCLEGRLAVANALCSDFCVITGGPGTGKTTSVFRLLLTIFRLRKNNGEVPPVIMLAAPTGKAAARLNESITGSLSYALEKRLITESEANEIKGIIPANAITVDKLLSTRPHSEKSNYSKDNPLNCDILIVDECSMISVSRFSMLVSSLGADTKLILLGDKDQLASVEAGRVLSSLTSEKSNALDPSKRELVMKLASVDDDSVADKCLRQNISMLTKSHRFDDDSKLGALAKAVNAGAAEQEIAKYCKNSADEKAKLNIPKDEEIEFIDLKVPQKPFNYLKDTVDSIATLAVLEYKCSIARATKSLNKSLSDEDISDDDIAKALNPFSKGISVKQAEAFLKAIDCFKVLCSNRVGNLGSTAINQAIVKKLLASGKNEKELYKDFFPGQVVMITRNDNITGVKNGEIGIVAKSSEHNDSLMLFLPPAESSADNRLRVISTTRLTDYDNGFAMTIHKSQGSEFLRICMVLPYKTNQLLTRELIYTGITRVKMLDKSKDPNHISGKLLLIGSKECFAEGCKKTVQRHSGIERMISVSN